MSKNSLESNNPLQFQLPEVMRTFAEVKEALDKENIYGLSGFFNHTQISQIVEAFYNARPDWIAGFEGEQFALGEVWYHYTEAGESTSTYFMRAAASRATVEKHIPYLQDYVLDYLRKFLETPNVAIREGWAGPGIVNFPARKWCAENGGAVHYDTEGLPGYDLRDPNLKTFSFVSMLQKPESGGNLLVWDKPFNFFDQADRDNSPDPKTFPNPVAAKINYKLGELWMFNGLRAHLIEPFQGNTDRICLTFHIAQKNNGWEVWF